MKINLYDNFERLFIYLFEQAAKIETNKMKIFIFNRTCKTVFVMSCLFIFPFFSWFNVFITTNEFYFSAVHSFAINAFIIIELPYKVNRLFAVKHMKYLLKIHSFCMGKIVFVDYWCSNELRRNEPNDFLGFENNRFFKLMRTQKNFKVFLLRQKKEKKLNNLQRFTLFFSPSTLLRLSLFFSLFCSKWINSETFFVVSLPNP